MRMSHFLPVNDLDLAAFPFIASAIWLNIMISSSSIIPFPHSAVELFGTSLFEA